MNHYQYSIKVNIGYLFLALLALVPLIPTFPRVPSLGVLKYIKFLIPFIIAVTGLFYTGIKVTEREWKTTLVLGILFLFLTAFSLALETRRIIIPADLFELFKPIDAGVIFIFCAGLHWTEYNLKKYFWRACSILLICSTIFAIIDISNLSIFSPIVEMYIQSRGVLYNKAVGFFYITYFAASVYMFLGSLFIGRFFLKGGKKNLLFAFLSLCLTLLTQSRSAFVGLFFIILYICFVYLVLNRKKVKPFLKVTAFWIVLIICCIFAFNWIQSNFGYLIAGIKIYILNFGNHLHGGGSLAMRYHQLLWVYHNNYMVLTGSGIGKGYNRLLESFYALYYYRYGLLGIIAYVFIWGYTFVICWKGTKLAKKLKMYDTAGFFLGFNIFIVGLPFISLSSVITDQPVLIPIFYGTVGVAFGAYRYLKTQKPVTK